MWPYWLDKLVLKHPKIVYGFICGISGLVIVAVIVTQATKSW